MQQKRIAGRVSSTYSTGSRLVTDPGDYGSANEKPPQYAGWPLHTKGHCSGELRMGQ